MSSEKQLRGFILARFFIILIIVSIVEFAVIILTNKYMIPALISGFNLDALNVVST